MTLEVYCNRFLSVSLIVPPELLKAHQANDRSYGMPIRETDEAACVAWLMRLYQEKVVQSYAK